MLSILPINPAFAFNPDLPRIGGGGAPQLSAKVEVSVELSASERKLSEREVACLAEAIYFEARGESVMGQEAVAQVIINRTTTGYYPKTICGVVYQNRSMRNACQFSFACDGKAEVKSEVKAWRRAKRIAREMTSGERQVAALATATNYHASYVKPRWARKMKRLAQIGRHIFYEEER